MAHIPQLAKAVFSMRDLGAKLKGHQQRISGQHSRREKQKEQQLGGGRSSSQGGEGHQSNSWEGEDESGVGIGLRIWSCGCCKGRCHQIQYCYVPKTGFGCSAKQQWLYSYFGLNLWHACQEVGHHFFRSWLAE